MGDAQGRFPYVAVFLRKDAEGFGESGTEGEEGKISGGAEVGADSDAGGRDDVTPNKDGVIEGSPPNALQQTFPEVISNLDEIHHVGTLAQVRGVTTRFST